jgi:hypothetical protein
MVGWARSAKAAAAKRSGWVKKRKDEEFFLNQTFVFANEHVCFFVGEGASGQQVVD